MTAGATLGAVAQSGIQTSPIHLAGDGAEFDRDKARGMRLDIPAGSAVRFEPGQARDVNLVPFGGLRTVYGFQQKIMGKL